jgi:PAS domain S-box-containing protein
MILLDKKGVVTKINPVAEKLFDYEKQELIGAHIKKLKPKVTPPF